MLKDKPNLIICEPEHQIRIVLSMYANCDSEPLPSNDELLFCTNKSTGEEIENFLRLVLTSPENESRLYCVANLQELSYEAQTTIEKYLHYDERFNTIFKGRFALVFVSTTSKPSLIASVLAKYRVTPVEFDDDMLRVYLHDKLVGHSKSVVVASDLDPDGFTVRVLTSKRSGSGKSKYVKHLIESKSQIDKKIVRIKSPLVDVDSEIYKLIENQIKNSSHSTAIIYHIDIAYEVSF